MKMKYKKVMQAVMGLSVISAFALSPLVLNTNVGAVSCSVLPQAICDAANPKDENGEPKKQGTKDTAVWRLLLLVVNILTAGVAILSIGGIIYGAILYTSAGDNQGQLAKAKDTIRNVIIGIVTFAFMFSLLQWLIPGGVFN